MWAHLESDRTWSGPRNSKNGPRTTAGLYIRMGDRHKTGSIDPGGQAGVDPRCVPGTGRNQEPRSGDSSGGAPTDKGSDQQGFKV